METILTLNNCSIKDIHTIRKYSKENPSMVFLNIVVEMAKPSRHLCEQLSRYQFSKSNFKVSFRKDNKDVELL